MNLFKYWREKGWQEIGKTDYQKAYTQYGGSVVTHPLVVEHASRISGMPLRYLGYFQNQEIKGAFPVWGKYIAGSNKALKKAGKHDTVDLGNAEVILPLSMEDTFSLKFESNLLSDLHRKNITNAKKRTGTTLSFLKDYEAGNEHSFSKKFKYNQRRELRRFQDAGGYYKSIDTLDSKAFAQIYTELFSKRWKGEKIKGGQYLADFIEGIRPLQKGFVLFSHEQQPVAIQLILQAESQEWISVEYINGGLDPEFKNFSIGSVLTYLNTHAAYDYANSRNKALRYSFGKTDLDYKTLWCYSSPLFCTGAF